MHSMGQYNTFPMFFSVIFTIILPVLIICIAVWIYKVKQLSEKQVKQNEEIIQLLKAEKQNKM